MIIFGDVALIVIGLGGAKNGGKSRRFHRTLGKKFFLSILVAYRLSILQGYPLKLFYTLPY